MEISCFDTLNPNEMVGFLKAGQLRRDCHFNLQVILVMGCPLKHEAIQLKSDLIRSPQDYFDSGEVSLTDL